MFSFPYTAQYSLGAVDLYENAVYFSENDNEGGDQIFRYDLNTKTKKNITNDLFAVNYIIPTKDKVFFAACKKDERNVSLGSYDKRTGEIKYWRDDKDTNIENMCVDQRMSKIYASIYSEKEDRYNLQHQGNDDFIIAAHSVWEIDFNLEQNKKLFSLSNRWVRML